MAVGETTEGQSAEVACYDWWESHRSSRALWLLADFRRLETLVVPPG